MSDTIFITGVVIHARHGVMEHETEVGQRFVHANAGDHHAVDRIAEPGRVLIERNRTRNPVVLSAPALEQRVAERGLQVRLPRACINLARTQVVAGELRGNVVLLVIRIVADAPSGAFRTRLRNA